MGVPSVQKAPFGGGAQTEAPRPGGLHLMPTGEGPRDGVMRVHPCVCVLAGVCERVCVCAGLRVGYHRVTQGGGQ